ncbi:MAG TPA: sigma-70 family RNA polymerase sigma factor [Thermomicrobiaceae bacterium]|nr:sigma-70 family RNA polymerase sigma factor [Thermomicrobiaceae bacterium]
MAGDQWLAEHFEDQRPHLRAVAYRMLGSLSEADDAIQELWLHLNDADTSDVRNLRAWLTTAVARRCLNVLRSRQIRREESLSIHVPDPIVSPADEGNPEQQALLADSVGLALLVVLEMLSPDERLAFVLHDMFGVPFDDIAPMVDRSPAAARQLASRARRRVQGRAPAPDSDLRSQREVVDAFFAAARHGDFEALVAVLHPNVVLRADFGAASGAPGEVRGPDAVARLALMFAHPDRMVRPMLINGAAGVAIFARGRPISLMGFTIVRDRIVEIDAIADARRLRRLGVADLDRNAPLT